MNNCIIRGFRRFLRVPAILFFLLKIAIVTSWRVRRAADREHFLAEQTQKWALGLLKILGIRLQIHGDTALPCRCGGLLVSNHQSYLDILVHAAVAPMRFTPNTGIRKWFFFGWYIGLSNPVWIDRTSPLKAKKTLEEFRTTLRNGICLIIYPEGTTTSGREPLLPFKSTAFEAVAGTDIPLIPLLTVYGTPCAGDHHPAWYDDTPFICHVRKILGNRMITADVHILPEITKTPEMDRKSLAQASYSVLEPARSAAAKEMNIK